jgi:formiminotetrahydrofolate cyclodeaminase
MEQGLADRPVRTFLDDLASSAPTPGGGAAAALNGAMAAALVAMVCNLTIGRPRYAAVDAPMRAVRERAERGRRELTDLIDADAVAYAAVAAAYRLPRATEEERAARTAEIQRALAAAAGPPLAAMDQCRALLPLALQVAAHGNATVVSDAGVAADLAVAATRASIVNVRVNLADLQDADFVRQAEARIASAEAGMNEDLDRVRALVRAKLAPKAGS